jgi:serine/threonine protein kinase/Flp pilus assembly protein TadD
VNDETRWRRLSELFGRLLASPDVAALLAAEPDPDLRAAAESLWTHHLEASQENYPDRIEIEVMPMFQPGQVLLNRFRIERMLGRGGMGEVYLAMDLRIEEFVAVKTVARLLAPLPEVCRRIATEVRSARRVAHDNVCRIHDLFEDGDTVFFSMEYVEGRLLSDLLGDPAVFRHARALVMQMAKGLQAAHATGVVHGDFKPGNVIVTGADVPRAVIMDFGLAHALDRTGTSVSSGMSAGAGTVAYMAPELEAGSKPSIRSDIFAFGKVARQLLPGDRLWDQCIKPRPQDRPASMAVIIRHLEPARREWIVGIAVTAAATATLGYLRFHPNQPPPFPAGARVLVNGFHSPQAVPAIRLARSLLLTALQQSPRLHTIDDQDLLPALRRLKPAGALPLAGHLLRQLLTQLRAAFWIDADLDQRGSRYSLYLRLLRVSDGNMVGETAIRDVPGVADLAQHGALWLRSFAGESEASIAVNPVAVGSYTSKVPEALEKYYDAMEHYAVAEMDEAIPLLEEAVRLDSNFAQAHSMLGMCLNPLGRYEEAFREVARAKDLAESLGLPERERAWILANYYSLSEDPVNMVSAAIQNVAYYPDEPRFQRVLARTLCQTGRAPEAVVHNRRAVELAPTDDLQWACLIDNLCEAGQFDQALSEFQTAIAKGGKSPWLRGEDGLPYLGMERYREAREAYEREPAGRYRTLDLQRPSVLEGAFERAITAVREYRAGARNPAEAHKANEFLCGLYLLSDQPNLAAGAVRKMADLPAYPSFAHRLDCAAFWAFRLGEDDTLGEVHERLAKIRTGWENGFTRTVERHAAALQSWRAGDMQQAESEILDASDVALSPWRLFDAAEFYSARGQHDRAEDYWQQLDEQRGTVLALWFPGVLPMAWLGRARTALARHDTAAARKYSQKILDHWAASDPGLKVVRAAFEVRNATKSL